MRLTLLIFLGFGERIKIHSFIQFENFTGGRHWPLPAAAHPMPHGTSTCKVECPWAWHACMSLSDSITLYIFVCRGGPPWKATLRHLLARELLSYGCTRGRDDCTKTVVKSLVATCLQCIKMSGGKIIPRPMAHQITATYADF